MLKNTTNIPNALVGAVLAHVLPSGCSIPSTVEVLNKRSEGFNGQWGWYFPREKRVRVYVPRDVPRAVTTIRAVTKRELRMASRVEFLVAVMAHEVRHHYQCEVWNTEKSKWKLGYDRLARIAKEVDAELAEDERLDAWRAKFL